MKKETYVKCMDFIRSTPQWCSDRQQFRKTVYFHYGSVLSVYHGRLYMGTVMAGAYHLSCYTGNLFCCSQHFSKMLQCQKTI